MLDQIEHLLRILDVVRRIKSLFSVCTAQMWTPGRPAPKDGSEARRSSRRRERAREGGEEGGRYKCGAISYSVWSPPLYFLTRFWSQGQAGNGFFFTSAKVDSIVLSFYLSGTKYIGIVQAIIEITGWFEARDVRFREKKIYCLCISLVRVCSEVSIEDIFKFIQVHEQVKQT